MIVAIVVGFPFSVVGGVAWCRHWRSLKVSQTAGQKAAAVSRGLGTHLDEETTDESTRKNGEAQVVWPPRCS